MDLNSEQWIPKLWFSSYEEDSSKFGSVELEI